MLGPSVIQDSNVKLALAALLSLLFIKLLSNTYSAFFGPLSRLPGPKTYAFSHIPIRYVRCIGADAAKHLEMHQKYGHVVRTSPDEISFNTAQAWKDIHSHKIGGKKSIPKDFAMMGQPATGTRSIIDANDSDHARMRKILSHSFSDKALREQEPLLRRYSDLLISKLREHAEARPHEPVNLVKWWNCATFDVMSDLTFSEPLGMLEKGDYVQWVKTIFASIKIGTRFRQFFLVPVLGEVVQFLLGVLSFKARRKHFGYTFDLLERRLAKTPEQPDLWTEVITRGEKNGITLDEMKANANIFMIAGTETTATLLSGLTFYLLQTPTTMARLLDEIRTSFKSTSDLSIDSLARLPYLNACIEEGFRMYPPVPVGAVRRTTAEGATIDGVFVPGNVTVSVSQWATYRSEDNWALPWEFHPERWLADPPKQFAHDARDALQPFGLGPRNCIGRNLAYHEARLLLASVLLSFDLELAPGNGEWHSSQKVYILWEKVPLMIRIRPRQTL